MQSNRNQKAILAATGSIALLVDIITIAGYFFSQHQPPAPLNVTLFILGIYAWLALSWFAIRTGFENGKERGIFQRRQADIRNAVLAIGLLTSTLSIGLGFLDSFWFLVTHIALFPVVYLILYWLIPVVHYDMRIFVTRKGRYINRTNFWVKPYKNHLEFVILRGEEVTVLGLYKMKWYDFFPKTYYVQCRHQTGVVSFEDIISKFKVARISGKD